jgi:hypothetical protein
MCVTLQVWAKYQYFHLHSDLPWSYVLNIDTNLVGLPEVVNTILPSVRTLNVICIAEIILFYADHSAKECSISVHILYTFLYTFCTHLCTNIFKHFVHYTFCTHLCTHLCTNFCAHSVHILYTFLCIFLYKFLYTFLYTFLTHFCTIFHTHSVHISLHFCIISLHILYAFLHKFCTHFCRHSVHISVHISLNIIYIFCTLFYSPSKWLIFCPSCMKQMLILCELFWIHCFIYVHHFLH